MTVPYVIDPVEQYRYTFLMWKRGRQEGTTVLPDKIPRFAEVQHTVTMVGYSDGTEKYFSVVPPWTH